MASRSVPGSTRSGRSTSGAPASCAADVARRSTRCHCEEAAGRRGNLVPVRRDRASRRQFVIEVAPFGIHAGDEIELLPARAGLDLLLPGNCGSRVLGDLIGNQLADIIAACAAERQLLAVLEDATEEVAGHAGIEDRVPLVG